TLGDYDFVTRLHFTEILAEAGLQLTDRGFHVTNLVLPRRAVNGRRRCRVRHRGGRRLPRLTARFYAPRGETRTRMSDRSSSRRDGEIATELVFELERIGDSGFDHRWIKIQDLRFGKTTHFQRVQSLGFDAGVDDVRRARELRWKDADERARPLKIRAGSSSWPAEVSGVRPGGAMTTSPSDVIATMGRPSSNISRSSCLNRRNARRTTCILLGGTSRPAFVFGWRSQ
ncbi:MAG: hypothetical protein QOD06_721, partial [Candidatus Binatota bacterium]|nr:hypothetical protein [Candidatus Binatota bacterium]